MYTYICICNICVYIYYGTEYMVFNLRILQSMMWGRLESEILMSMWSSGSLGRPVLWLAVWGVG